MPLLEITMFPLVRSSVCHHHQPKPTITTIRNRTLMATHRHRIIVDDTPSWVLDCCDHDTDPLLDPPKGRPQNGGHVWIRNRPPKRCPPTVGGHFLGGGKWTPKVAPRLWPFFRSPLVEFSGRLNLHVTTKQRSHGSQGSPSMSTPHCVYK